MRWPWAETPCNVRPRICEQQLHRVRQGGRGYWNKIRRDFPEVFERRAKQEREIGHSCIKGVFLDELDPESGRMETEIMPACSFDCLGVLEGEA